MYHARVLIIKNKVLYLITNYAIITIVVLERGNIWQVT